LFSGPIASLKHFKDDVREVRNGLEGGVSLEGFNDYREGDVLEAHRTELAQ
jgi:translation initiation factor IF-2